MSDVQKAQLGIKRSEAGELVEFGIEFPNGGFFPFAASRAGDYDEALAADAQPEPPAQPQTEPEAPADPVSEPTQTAPAAPEQPVDNG